MESTPAEVLLQTFPYGHPDFIQLALDEVALHSKKNHDYAGPQQEPLGNFHRVGEVLKIYPLLQHSGKEPLKWAFLQMLKQLDAVLWMTSAGYEGTVEGLESRLQDIAVYCKIAILLNREDGVK